MDYSHRTVCARAAVLAGALACGALVGCKGGEATSEGASETSGAGSTTGSSGAASTTGGTLEPTTTGSAAGSSSSGDVGSTTEAPLTSGSSTGETGSTGATEGASSTTDDSTTGAPIDCAALPQGPLTYTIKPGPTATEDLAFDDQGNLIGASAGNLFKTPFDGPSQLWVPGAGGFIAGLRATAKGVVVYADNDTMTLFRVNPAGFKEMVLGGLEYANGLEVDLDGFVYVAEQSGGRVRRVDPATGQFTILAEGLSAPNGLSFSPDYRTLYVGSFGGGTITAIALHEDMTAAGTSLFKQAIGSGGLDGMGVDACGNVYVCEFGPAIVWRFSPDGTKDEQLVNLGGETAWIPNLQWGSGIGGWDRETLYVLDFSGNRVFEVPVGVTDKPRGYP